jgi:Rieske [2Fe-2S] domain
MSTMVPVELDWPEHNAVIVGNDHYFTLVRNGTVHVVASTCPHRGGPLHLGTVQGERLRCPWHGNTMRVDRLCHRSIPVVQRGNRVIAYLPASEGTVPTPTNVLVLAE